MKRLAAWIVLGMAYVGYVFAQQDPATRGQQTFDYWCATCHGTALGEGGRPLPGTASLASKYNGALPPALADRTDLPSVYIKLVVRGGTEGMPSFRKTEVSDSDLENIAAYLTRNAAQTSEASSRSNQGSSK
jgi:mono/diheme cytochrome c family protein